MNRALPTRKAQTRTDVADDMAPDLHRRPDLPNCQRISGTMRREEFASIQEIERYLNALNIAYHEASYGPVP